jgi:hypothetical protein
MTRKLIATRPLRYNTRSLVAGDEFDATDMHARILVGIRKARHAPEMPAPAVAAAEDDDNDLFRLRGEAKRLGIEVDGRWGTIRLRHEIAQARQDG